MKKEKVKYWQKYFDQLSEKKKLLHKKADYSSDLSFEVRYTHIKSFLKQINLNGKRILDAGCGVGLLIELLKREYNSQIVGVDLSLNALKVAKRYESNLIQGSVTNLPFGEGVFDAVFCVEVLQYINDWQNTIKEISRVMKQGGSLILSTLSKKCLFLQPKILGFLKKLKFTGMDKNIVLHDKHLIKEFLERQGYIVKEEIDLPVPVRGGNFLLKSATIPGFNFKSLFSYAFVIFAQKQ